MKADVKVLDCTIRDGGLVNNWEFSVDFVREVYKSLSSAGVDYMEIGYKNSPKLVSTDGVGPWRFCEDDFIREVFPEKTNTKLSAIVDIGRVDVNDILPCVESPIDLIRVACYLKDIDKAIDLVNTFNELGYETSINIMAVSNSLGLGLHEALEKINNSPVDMAYIVDSFGSLYNKDIEYLITTFKKHAPNIQLGIHTHNNLQMAFSNTILGLQQGVNFLDTSIFGMGRGAGNCPTELILGYLNSPRYDVRPILEVIENLFVPLREKVEWGYNTAYALTGFLNEHPRSAIALRKSEGKNNFLGFYDKLTSVETHNDIN
jgi:4-hydroxy 2-oxovalerate aldolase